MRRTFLPMLLVLVAAPLGTVAFLAARLARQEQHLRRERVRELASSTLADVDRTVHGAVEEARREIQGALDPAPEDADGWRARRRRVPLATQLFAVDAGTGELRYPSLADDLSRDEEDFLRRTKAVWTGRLLVPSEGRGSAANEAEPAPSADGGAARGFLWEGAGPGARLLWWWRQGPRIVGAEVERTRLLGRIVSALPGEDAAAPGAGARLIRLTDESGVALYQWGRHRPAAGAAPLARLSLAPPLHAFSLELYAEGGDAAGAALLPSLPYLALLTVVVLALALHVYRESTRAVRDASQRVSFVNQVSHELKTPLTSIRMYAELLEDELSDQPEARHHAEVVAAESRRLSRLIGNILTFARGAPPPSVRPAVADEVVAGAIELFRPSLEARGVAVSFRPQAPERAPLDADALGQILGNLLSNVEKYAASGGRVDVATCLRDGHLQVRVADAGPGIPERERERIFEPFYRIDDRLSAGVTGTGIGLSIARELARRQGGDVRLEPAAAGATFLVTIPITRSAS